MLNELKARYYPAFAEKNNWGKLQYYVANSFRDKLLQGCILQNVANNIIMGRKFVRTKIKEVRLFYF